MQNNNTPFYYLGVLKNNIIEQINTNTFLTEEKDTLIGEMNEVFNTYVDENLLWIHYALLPKRE